MGISQLFKISRKTFFNPSAWIDAESLQTNTQTLWSILKDTFTVPTPEREESFDQARKRLGLSEKQIQQTGKRYLTFAIILASCGIFCLLFTFYLLIFKWTVHGWIIGLVATALFFAQAFRFHFWYFQIKNHKLGCTFEEYTRGKVSDQDTSA